jgi:hypothetical protein
MSGYLCFILINKITKNGSPLLLIEYFEYMNK